MAQSFVISFYLMVRIFLFVVILCILAALLIACTTSASGSAAGSHLDTSGKTLDKRFLPPDSFERMAYKETSFGAYLRTFSLQNAGHKVLLYNGDLKSNQAAAAAVLSIDVGDKDLQQCADAVMRLRAEYLYKNKKYDQIHFQFTNGFRADYQKWASGYRIKVAGNRANWYLSRSRDFSYRTFRSYMDMVFSYAGSLSLSKEMKSKPLDSIHAGDILIQGGSPGHAVIVMDVAKHIRTGKRIYILAQSYMPAQEIHVLVNPASKGLSPWYEVSDAREITTPEWVFSRDNLKYFAQAP